MISRIENSSGGKYLYIQQESEENSFETRMAASLVSDSIMTPAQVFAYGGMCYEYCITGLKELEEYLSGIRLHSQDLIRLLAQLEQSVNTVKNYLLSEADLLINTEFIYADEEKGLLKLCIVPGYNGDFEQGLKELISRLLIHIDAADESVLRLGFRLFKTITQGEFKLHDIISALHQPEARPVDAVQGFEGLDEAELDMDKLGQKLQYDGLPRYADADKYTYVSSQQGVMQEREPYSADAETGEREYKGNAYAGNAYTGMRQDYNAAEPAADINTDTEHEAKPRSILKDTIGGLAVSQGILIAVAAAVFLLKGRTTVMKLIPIYIIIAACVTVYYIISFILKRRQQAQAI